MGDAEELNLLRQRYEQALAAYEAACAALNHRVLAGTRPSEQQLQDERDAREGLSIARSSYLEAWKKRNA